MTARLFIWFWLTAICSFILLPLAGYATSGGGLWVVIGAETPMTFEVSRLAIKSYEKGDQATYKDLLKTIDSNKVRGCIIGPDGVALPSGNCAAGAIELGREILKTRAPKRRVFGEAYLNGRHFVGEKGDYAFVASPVLGAYGHIAQFLLRAAVILLLVLLFTYVAASMLARPLELIREAASRIAGGDLAARLDSRVLGRSSEVGSLARDFNRMADRVESLIVSQKALIRDTSHELRSPLSRIRVAADLATNSGSASRATASIIKSVDQMDHLLSQMLELARMEGKEIEYPLMVLDVGATLESVVEDAAFEAESVGKKVVFSLPIGVVSRVNPDLLRSAAENVLRNAIRHSPEGQVVELELNKSVGVEISIRDYGSGVPQNHLDSIFSAFHRVEEDRGRQTGGHGLGLSIAKRAVELMGGSIRAENSRPGLRVTLSLPLPPVGGAR